MNSSVFLPFLAFKETSHVKPVSLRTVGARLLPDDAFEAAASWGSADLFERCTRDGG